MEIKIEQVVNPEKYKAVSVTLNFESQKEVEVFKYLASLNMELSKGLTQEDITDSKMYDKIEDFTFQFWELVDEKL